MSHVGMWMPKQKSGKNWAVDFQLTVDGNKGAANTKTFRVRAEAQDFIDRTKTMMTQDSREVSGTFKIRKLDK